MEKRKKSWATVLSILIVCAAVISAVIYLTYFWPCYHCISPCSCVESDAHYIASAIAAYFAVPEHTHIMPRDLYDEIRTENPWTFIQCGNAIYIYVYDLNEDCPVDYQNLKSEWNASIYTKIME